MYYVLSCLLEQQTAAIAHLADHVPYTLPPNKNKKDLFDCQSDVSYTAVWCILRKNTKHEKVLFWAGNFQKKHPPTSVGVFCFPSNAPWPSTAHCRNPQRARARRPPRAARSLWQAVAHDI
jgi:hypothetical protein